MQDNDLSKQISDILSDPEAMARVMSLAGSLMGGLGADGGGDVPSEAQPTEKENKELSEEAQNGAAFREDEKNASRVSGLGAVSALAGLMGKDKKNDPRANLLFALKPYMRSDRAEKIDMLIKAMRLADIAGDLMGSGLIDTGGDKNVQKKL